MRTIRILTLAFLAILFVMACNKDQTVSSNDLQTSASNRDCTPEVTVKTEGPGGNYSCPAGFDNTSTRIEIDQTVNPQSDTEGPISWSISADGKYLSWSGNVCGLVVVVKGATSSNVYTFDDDCKGASGLTAPIKNGKYPQISNITFCWDDCDGECAGETAFGGNTAGPGSAWWYSFAVANGACQDIYAGQHLMAGASVCYDPVTSTFNITLGDNWQQQAGKTETVKIQGYNTLPGKRPAAGLFTHYKGDDLTAIQVPAYPYYIVHLDVEYCPDPE
jgi:hypothetical protein